MAVDVKTSVLLQHRVLARMTYGPTATSVAELAKRGLASWVTDQLNPKKTESTKLTQMLSQFRGENMTTAEFGQDTVFSAKKAFVIQELTHTTILREIYSSRQLFETLVEFFNDYLPVTAGFSGDVFRKAYDQEVIRKHALDTYPNMLVAATFHPAMMDYLNLNQNSSKRPNENYARELLELFTITPASKYKETDVIAAAKLMTGLRWDGPTQSLKVSLGNRYFGAVEVFGYKNENAKTTDQELIKARITELVNYLALRPETAKEFSTRLLRRYVSDSPSTAYVSRLSKVYLTTKGSIPAVVKAMVLDAEFLKTAAKKTKRPLEHTISTIRAIGAEFSSAPIGNADSDFKNLAGSSVNIVHTALVKQGHGHYQWDFPDGYPDVAQPWSTFSAQVQRWNLAGDLLLGLNKNFTKIDSTKFVPSTDKTVTQIVDRVSIKFLGRILASAPRAALISTITKEVGAQPTGSDRTNASRLAAIFVLSSPDWNLR
jgi:uncharacterized protein (DUF1800 family)